MPAAMSEVSHGLVSRNAPILGAGLVVVALGSLVFMLSARDGRARTPADSTEVARGTPIRSAVTARATGPAPAQDKPPQTEFEELKFATLSGFDYPKSGSFQVGPAGETRYEASASDTPASPTKIPADVRAFDGRRVQVTGFMNPIEFDGDGVKNFALTAIPGGCCYGAIPRLNEWVVVTMPEGQRADYAYYDPVTIFGSISIGELYEDGVILSLYRMTPEKIDIGY